MGLRRRVRHIFRLAVAAVGAHLNLEAGLGFLVLGMVVGYLPVLYQSYSGRELHIGLLDARAGSPPSAGELLRTTPLELAATWDHPAGPFAVSDRFRKRA